MCTVVIPRPTPPRRPGGPEPAALPALECVCNTDGPHIHQTADGTRFIGAIIGSHDVLVLDPEAP